MPRKKNPNLETRGEETTYFASLDAGGEHLASITLRATDDEDAKTQLERAKPAYFAGVGKWTLTKRAYETVEV